MAQGKTRFDGWLIGIIIPVICAIFFLLVQPAFSGQIKKDETVLFFPTSASLDENGRSWIIPVHAWVFEMEEDSILRKALLSGLAEFLGIDEIPRENRIFRKRAAYFLVDNERSKDTRIRFGNMTVRLQSSEPNGHAFGVHHIAGPVVDEMRRGKKLPFSAVLPEGDLRTFGGAVFLVNHAGVSVISDIDDTIKISEVLDKKKLIENTFFKKFHPVPGMVDVYRKWEKRGAVFHYVSSSPWQLFPPLYSFMKDLGFPEGDFHLRYFRMKDSTIFNLFKSSETFKPDVIASIFRTFPERRFILVGDSGEKDPEIYAGIARKFPDRVMHIFIRDIDHGNPKTEKKRFQTVFMGISGTKWTVFRDPSVLSDYPFDIQ